MVKEIEGLGRRAFAVQADFFEEKGPEYFFEQIIKKTETLDILVNCAAAYERGSLLEIKSETFSWMYKINVEVPLKLIQHMALHLIKRKAAGSVINISSISGSMPSIGSCLNSCSKAGLDMLTKSAALELAPYNIRVNGIAPGATETESNQPYIQQDPKGWQSMIKKIPLGRAGLPQDIGMLAVFLASEASGWITGVTVICDGGTTLSWQ